MLIIMRFGTDLANILSTIRQHWRIFLGIHVAANLLSLAVLTPLYTLLTGWLILASGDAALTDEDILLFALSPLGLLVTLIVAGLYLTLLVFEQSALFLAGYRLQAGHQPGLVELARYLLQRAWSIFLFSLRTIGFASLVLAPFGVAVVWIVGRYLSEYDINYYLAERPAELWTAAGAITVCLLLVLWPMMGVLARWFIGLPLLLVTDDTPGAAFRRGKSLSPSMRLRVTFILIAWVVLNAILLGMAGLALDVAAGFAIRIAGESLQVLAYLMGGLLVLWLLAALFVTFFTSTILALAMLWLHKEAFPGAAGPRLGQDLAPQREQRAVRVSWLAVAGILLVLLSGAAFVILSIVDQVDPGQSTAIVAHRGASMDAPENTLASLEEAIRQRADWVEIDVQETREGGIVVIHDRDLMKVGGVPMNVRDAAFAELRNVDIGSWFDDRFRTERIATLAEVLDLCKGRVKLIVELKYYGGEVRFEERVIEIIESHQMQEDIALMSLNYRGVETLKSLRPDWNVGLLSSVVLGNLEQLNVDFLAVNGRLATRGFIQSVHERNRKILVWTINDPVEISAMMSKGVDGIITDRPGVAKTIRDQRADLKAHELLIIRFASLLGGRVKPVQ
ncbi:MAG: glycerophosphodiester phosphodiesterase [Gammaproteobacteria bacterium]|nr:glycerophosphodiester phosphodiesterase [Gammaproteobacteria bacterium]MDH4316153.1 glycerophosphodiester phosphodiesterase [Gammaproteobacteria bacterium]MDH5215351.1 glycerophosphodiester phosphodiesterase [Gammaproteobacteria bacterium]